MVELVVRLVFSLAVVLGMLVLLTRFSAKRFRGGADALVRVLHRQPLSRTSSVSVVTIGDRVLVLGTTEHQVRLLVELDPHELDHPAPVASVASASADGELETVNRTSPRHAAPLHAARSANLAARAAEGALAGSLLSAQTWKQALAAASRSKDAS